MKRIGFDNVSCEYCKFKDICFMKEDNIKILGEVTPEGELEADYRYYHNGGVEEKLPANVKKYIAENNIQSDGSTFLFAVGDGNHSLATAKAIWDELKEANGGIKAADGTISIPKELENHNARFALVEIVNIYDTGLTFEPIHRVLFNVKPQDLLTTLAEKLNGTVTDFDTAETLENNVKNSVANFGFTYTEDGIQKYKCLSTNITELAVSKLQPALDEFIKNAPNQHICDENGCRLARPEIDYIHGSAEVFRLGKQENAISILLPPVEKDSFFQTISKTGPLPRKSFSMGEADEKRFYLECRKLFAN